MAGEWKCRSCAAPVSGAAHIVLPRNLAGTRCMCLTCVDQLMDKYHTRTLHELVPRYVKDQKQDTPLRELKERVRQLEALLSEVTDPNK